MAPLLTSNGKHYAVFVFPLRVLPRRFQTVHDHIRMPSGGSIPRHPVPKENQKGDAYSVYLGVFTRWMFGLWFSLTVHGLQIGAPDFLRDFSRAPRRRPFIHV